MKEKIFGTKNKLARSTVVKTIYMKLNNFKILVELALLLTFVLLHTQNLVAQQCGSAAASDNNSYAKLRAGSGFVGSYSLPCITQATYTEIQVPFKVFNTIAKGNGDDTVYSMKIESISNLPCGVCWVSSSSNNTFKVNEGGYLLFRGTSSDQIGQYNLTVTLSFDTNGDGILDRTNVNYNKVSKTGRMVLRVTDGQTACEPIKYDIPGITAGDGSTCQKQ